MILCSKSQGRFCAKKEKDISIVKNRKERFLGVFARLVKKEVYLTIKITIDITSVICVKEGWKEENGTVL